MGYREHFHMLISFPSDNEKIKYWRQLTQVKLVKKCNKIGTHQAKIINKNRVPATMRKLE